ncbi:hypothetical protein CVT25_007346 [Psilocybe cyanescens]|uniref:F-box domain-containing protein n=1 Tax=Psilocybe cyanescens TaxID=93625 RepID=A0A409XJH0_PSICY|nr:hypothetical protein CVT25_007346 [Psilocybe cyanescens]
MILPILPQELVDHIVDDIGHEEDNSQRIAALSACSLASWSFLTPARRNRFRFVSLVEGGGRHKFTREQDDWKHILRLEAFAKLLLRDPCKAYPNHTPLSQHIGSLAIELSRYRAEPKLEETAQKRARLDSILPRILALIPSIRLLRLFYDYDLWKNDSLQWAFLGDSMKKALEDFCISRPIEYLDLAAIRSFPMAIITNCRHLKDLWAANMVDPDWASPLQTVSTDQGPFTPVLENLHVINSSDLVSGLAQYGVGPQAVIRLSFLRVLDMSSIRFAAEWTLISTPNQISPAQLDFGSLANLQTLTIYRLSFGHTASSPGLLSLTKWRFFDPKLNSKAPSSLETLDISGSWSNCTRRDEIKNFLPRSGWNAIDDVLSSGRFPRLCNIQLSLTLNYHNDPTVPDKMGPSLAKELTQDIQEKLPQLFPSLSRSLSTKIGVNLDVNGYMSYDCQPTFD